MGKAPHLKIKVKSMIHRQEALSLVGQGWPITKISEHMGIAVQSVRRLLRQALATESLYPNQLTPERVAELRVLEAEQIAASVRKVVVAQDNAAMRLRDKNASVQAAAEISVVRCHEALMRSSERLAKLFGLDQPTKVVEESMRIQLTKVDGRIKVEFDREQLRAKRTPLGITDCDGQPYERITNGSTDGS
jgi:hypothetical protein